MTVQILTNHPKFAVVTEMSYKFPVTIIRSMIFAPNQEKSDDNEVLISFGTGSDSPFHAARPFPGTLRGVSDQNRSRQCRSGWTGMCTSGCRTDWYGGFWPILSAFQYYREHRCSLKRSKVCTAVLGHWITGRQMRIAWIFGDRCTLNRSKDCTAVP